MNYRLFGVYSGRNKAKNGGPPFGAVYEDTRGVSHIPVTENDPLFLDLVSYGVDPGSNVSVYVRIYDDGRITYLGPNGRHRAMPKRAADNFRFWLMRRDDDDLGGVS